MKLKTLRTYAAALLLSVAPAWASAAPGEQPAPDRHLILVVMTNHDRYLSRTDTTTGLWLGELTEFTDVVEAAGYTPVLVSPKGGKVPLDQRSLSWIYKNKSAQEHLASPAFRDSLEHTLPIASVDPAQFDAIYFTGGHGVMWDFPDDPDIQRVAIGIYEHGGVVAAVCHGPAALINLKDEQGRPLIQGRHVTGFSDREEQLSGMKPQVPFSLQDRLIGQGALYSEGWIPFTSHVVTDGRIITGQNPESPKAVGQALVSLLSKLHLAP
jgi:putative intracellular protease/amidase